MPVAPVPALFPSFPPKVLNDIVYTPYIPYLFCNARLHLCSLSFPPPQCWTPQPKIASDFLIANSFILFYDQLNQPQASFDIANWSACLHVSMPLFYPGPLPVSLPVMSLLCQCFILLLTHMVAISWVAGLEVIFSLYTLPTFRPFIYSASSTCLLYYNVSQVCIFCPVRVVISLLPCLSTHPWIKTTPYSQVATTGPGSHTAIRPLPWSHYNKVWGSPTA